MLTKRQIQLIQYLINAPKSVSLEMLADILGATQKTIRGDIEIIEPVLLTVGSRILSKPGTGYQIEIIDPKEFGIFLDTFNAKYTMGISYPYYDSERIHSILYIFLTQDYYVNVGYLCEHFHISKTKMADDLRIIRSILKEYHLKFSSNRHAGLRITGQETHRRFAILEFSSYFEDSGTAEIPLIPLRIDYRQCYTTLVRHLKRFHVHVSYKSLHDLVILLQFSITRMETSAVLWSESQLQELKNLEEYQLSKDLFSDLQINAIAEEIAFFAVAVATRRSYTLRDSFDMMQHKELFFECDAMLQALMTATHINFLNDWDLRQLLTRELRGMALRLKYGFEYRNTRNLRSKQNMPTYNYAIIMCEQYAKKHNIRITDEEIANIAVLLQRSLSKYNINYTKQRICLIFNDGYLSSRTFYNLLKNNYDRYILDIDTCEYYELEERKGSYDVIMTDMPLNYFSNSSAPIYQYNYHFDETSRKHIKNILLDRKGELAFLEQALSEDLVLTGLAARTATDSIRQITDQMTLTGRVSKDFRQQVMVREEFSSTECQYCYAMPQALTTTCDRTTIGIGILKHKILWKREHIQLVIVVANGRDEPYPFMSQSLFCTALRSIEFLHEFLIARSKNDIIQQFRKFYL